MELDLAYYLTSNKTKPNKIMREKILPYFLAHNIEKILDYGCGRFLRDSIYLAEHGLIVDAVDLEEQVQRINPEKAGRINSLSACVIRGDYDAVLLNFVLQVLPTKKQRAEVLESVCSAIRNDGYLVLSLRNQRDVFRSVEKCGIAFNDGFLMRKGKYYTFVRGYEKTEIEELLNKSDLAIVNIFSTPDSFVALSRKK